MIWHDVSQLSCFLWRIITEAEIGWRKVGSEGVSITRLDGLATISEFDSRLTVLATSVCDVSSSW